MGECRRLTYSLKRRRTLIQWIQVQIHIRFRDPLLGWKWDCAVSHNRQTTSHRQRAIRSQRYASVF